MTGEERFRWMVFIGSSLLLHAAALAWLDLSGADIGRLPSKLTVLLASRSEGEGNKVAETPASASRSRDLFDRPTARAQEPEPSTTAEREPAIDESASAPERVAVARETRPAPRIEKNKKPVTAPEPERSPVRESENASASPPVAASGVAPPEGPFTERQRRATPHAAAASASPARAADESGFGTAEAEGRLLSLLHDAISREKRYPMLARRQRREGTATVSFSLSPSGEMDAIDIDRSSGFSVLDSAAVSAVSRVAPFSPARLFLSDVTRFKVDVTFKLN